MLFSATVSDDKMSSPTLTAVAGVSDFTLVCLCVFLRHDVSRTDAAMITKPDREMFHDESWKGIYFGVKWSKVKVISRKTLPVLHAWVFALLWLLACSSFHCIKLFQINIIQRPRAAVDREASERI